MNSCFSRARMAMVAAVAAALMESAACGRGKVEAQRPQPTVPVVVATVQQHDVPVNITAIGNVEPYSTVQIKSQVNGQLTGVYFKEGQDVRKGQLLFTLDKRPFEAELRRMQGMLAQDQAKLENAQVQARRYEALMKEGVIAREQADAMISSANSMQATVEADRAAVENARVQLQYCTIYAPIAGRTGNLIVHQGNMVKANDTQFLVVINQIEPVYVSFAVPQQHLPDIKRFVAQRKLPVNVEVPNEQRAAVGTLSFIDNTVDPTTGTIRLKGSFVNHDRRLWPGQFAQVTLTLATQPNALTVPTAAVQMGQNGQYVFVVKPDGTAENRGVKVERTVGNVAVVAEGLKAGETVVTDGQMRLVPGAKVAPKSAESNPGAAAAGNSQVSGS